MSRFEMMMSGIGKIAAARTATRALLRRVGYTVPLVAACLCGTYVSHGEEASALPEPVERAVDFRSEVLPIFSQHCFRCHSGDEPDGNLKLSGRDELLRGGGSGPAVVPGESGKSLLIQLVAGEDAERVMPADGEPLSAEQITTLRAWIDQGLTWEGAKEYHLPLLDVELPPGEGHPIDRLLAPYHEQHGVSLGDLISDERFARRAAFDLVGVPLSAEQLAEFLADRRASKREALVRRLLADHENYVAHWMSFWSDHLRIGSAVAASIFDDDGTAGPQKWLKDQLERDVPFDRFAQELIAGEFFDHYAKSMAPPGEVATPVEVPEMQVATTAAQVFLGIQLKCASCHDSFIDRWTLREAWGLAGALGEEPFEIYRCEVPIDEMAAPRFPLASLGEIDAAADVQQRRSRVAELMTAAENGLFARTIVNRLWARLFGRGLVEPLDEMMEHEPWRPELLDWLAGELIRQDYDLKKILLLIATSQAYQAPVAVRQEAAQDGEYLFQGPELRRLTAEQFVDALGVLYGAVQGPARAWQQQNNRLMTMLGRPGRDVVVTSREEEATPLLALELINGGELDQLVREAAAAQLKQSGTAQETAPRIYRTLLGREPTAQERTLSNRVLGQTPSQETIADLIWVVIMLPEFQLLH